MKLYFWLHKSMKKYRSFKFTQL